MDPYLEELARLAHNAALDAAPPIDEDPPSSQVARYQRLFHYSAPEALTLIRQQRSDPTRLRVPDTLWTLVQSSASAAGYDREAYEHCLRVGRQPFHQAPPTRRPSVPLTTATEEAATYLLKLDGPLARPSDVQAAANLPAPPPVLDGKGENGSASFCLVGALARQAIDAWLAARHSPFRPTFIRYSIARKALSPTSASPTLGIDATLPQHRPGSACAPCLPAQNQYPVWYFLYGTLADPSVLAAQLDLPEDKAPVLREARVRGGGGVLKSWGGKYRALVDGPREAEVWGRACEVEGEEQERALRVYETERYEVVRCGIEVDGVMVRGCTFRFAGAVEELGEIAEERGASVRRWKTNQPVHD